MTRIPNTCLGRRLTKGFTLLELMVTVAVLAIVMSVAVPSFVNLVNGNRLTAQSNEILAALLLARTEAIKRNESMVFCHSDDSINCTVPPAAGWQGWLVLGVVDDTPVASGIMLSEQTVMLSSTNVANAQVNGVGHSVRFNPQGLLRSGDGNNPLNGVLRVCLPNTEMPMNIRDIEMRSGGRTRVIADSAGENCPQPNDPV